MPEPFRITPLAESINIPERHRQCSRCRKVLPQFEFHDTRPACKSCIRADNNARYAANKARRMQPADDD